MNEQKNRKCLHCRYCANSEDCDFRQEKIKWLNGSLCEDYWESPKINNYGFEILTKNDFDENGHQKYII